MDSLLQTEFLSRWPHFPQQQVNSPSIHPSPPSSCNQLSQKQLHQQRAKLPKDQFFLSLLALFCFNRPQNVEAPWTAVVPPSWPHRPDFWPSCQSTHTIGEGLSSWAEAGNWPEECRLIPFLRPSSSPVNAWTARFLGLLNFLLSAKSHTKAAERANHCVRNERSPCWRPFPVLRVAHAGAKDGR